MFSDNWIQQWSCPLKTMSSNNYVIRPVQRQFSHLLILAIVAFCISSSVRYCGVAELDPYHRQPQQQTRLPVYVTAFIRKFRSSLLMLSVSTFADNSTTRRNCLHRCFAGPASVNSVKSCSSSIRFTANF